MTRRGAPGPQRGGACTVRLLLGLVLALTPAAPAAGSDVGWLARFPSMVAGIVMDTSVIAAGVPLASGPWGTDHITVSHALGGGRRYSVLREGLPPRRDTADRRLLERVHGIDALILRAPAHVSNC